MAKLIFFLGCLFGVVLLLEHFRSKKARLKLKHVIYVNGIRGKSTVTRLIDAGLRAGGWKVYGKTTGTIPMVIGIDNIPSPLFRPGRANIKEQLHVLHQAARQGAEILVIECMAVDPALQILSQRRMLHSDIGVITNVRLDHTAEMGSSLEEICDSLSGTIPEGGVLFTADSAFFPQLQRNAHALRCNVHLAIPDTALPAFDFPENICLALAVCEYLGVPRSQALEGMLHYHPDPYVLSVYQLPTGSIFVNALSVNDPQSTLQVYHHVCSKLTQPPLHLILLINNRSDRGYRTDHMMMVASALAPDEVWLIGTAPFSVHQRLSKLLNNTPVHYFSSPESIPFQDIRPDCLIFAAGNVAGPGKELMELIRKVGTSLVL